MRSARLIPHPLATGWATVALFAAATAAPASAVVATSAEAVKVAPPMPPLTAVDVRSGRRGVLTVGFTLLEPGVVTAKATFGSRSYGAVKVTASKAGHFRLIIRPVRRTKQALRSRRSLQVTVLVQWSHNGALQEGRHELKVHWQP